MLKKVNLLIIFLILIFSIFNILINIDQCSGKENNFFYVGGIGTGNYTTIQGAINESGDNDTIYVYNGIYNEKIIINKSINLVGFDKNSTILSGNNSLYIIFIKSSWINITGFTIQNGKMGIYISDVNYSFNNISKNILQDNWEGIRLYKSSNNKIINNYFSNNKNLGVILDESKNNILYNNRFFNSNKAIILNRWSDGNLILKNNLTDNFIGLSLYSSFRNLIDKNFIANCTNGLYLSYSTNNTIIENIIEFNDRYGIFLISSYDNEITQNYFFNNYQDIKKGPEPPKIKAPGFELIIFVGSLLYILFIRKKLR
ncbi:hypothetical protein AYK24_10095 [Thermoplasmatales archaeon SG8-52-4]|nr:MAG: hypothetical protein AYK24_10095 [Thermoplasmatales archaeon SG8-52-4]